MRRFLLEVLSRSDAVYASYLRKIYGEGHGQKSDPFLHFSELGYFVPLKFIFRKVTIFSLLVLTSSAMSMFRWNMTANKLMEIAALSLHGRTDNIIICQTVKVFIFYCLFLWHAQILGSVCHFVPSFNIILFCKLRSWNHFSQPAPIRRIFYLQDNLGPLN